MSSVATQDLLEKYKDIIGSNRSHAMDRWVLGIHGPPGHGKTWFAATASKDFPETPSPTKPTKLTDVLWLAADSGATAGLAEAGIEIDQIDVRDLIAMHEGNMVAACSALVNLVVRLGGREKVVVLDTASQLDIAWQAFYLDEKRQPRTRTGDFDTQKFYALIRSAWLTLHNGLHQAAPRLIYTFHTKNVVEPGERDASQAAETLRNTVKAGALPGDVSLTIAMTGQARDMMIREATAILRVAAAPDTRNPGKFIRRAYSSVQDGFAAKNRWQGSIPAVADAHLGKLLEGVRKALGTAA